MLDAEQFTALLDPVLEVAYNLAYRYTGNRDDAMDIVQEASVQAFRRRETFQLGSNFRAWFLKIVVNLLFRTRARESRLGPRLSLNDAEDLYFFERMEESGLHTAATDPAAELLQEVDSEAIQEALMALPDEFRLVAALYFNEEKPYEEIAGIMGVPIGTVRSRLHRSRKLLQKQLWEVARERGVVSGPFEDGP